MCHLIFFFWSVIFYLLSVNYIQLPDNKDNDLLINRLFLSVKYSIIQ